MTTAPPAPVSVARLHGADTQGPGGRALGRLHGVSCLLFPGVTAVLGGPADGTLALCELCAGRSPPRLGSVLVGGREPHRSRWARKRVGSLDWRPPALPGRTVADALARIGRLRGVDLGSALPSLGASRLATAACDALAHEERRAVELAVALALPDPVLLALYEPFVAVAALDPAGVRRRLGELSAKGSVVVLAVRELSDAVAVASRALVLERGLICQTATSQWPPVAMGRLVVWLGPDDQEPARQLAAALSGREELQAVTWQDWGPSGSSVRAAADRLETAAATVAEVVTELGVRVAAVHPEPIAASELRAATALPPRAIGRVEAQPDEP